MKTIIVLIISFIFFIPLKVEAVFCDYSELSKLKSLASNINYSYSYVELDNDVTFSIEFLNLKEELILQDISNNKLYNIQEESLVINGYESGKSYSFVISTNETECTNKQLSTFTVTLPSYNKYYNEQICIDNPEISLCGKWIKVTGDRNDFVKTVNSFIKTSDVEENPNTEIELTFIEKYYIYIYMVSSMVILIYIYQLYLSRKDDFDLDTNK